MRFRSYCFSFSWSDTPVPFCCWNHSITNNFFYQVFLRPVAPRFSSNEKHSPSFFSLFSDNLTSPGSRRRRRDAPHRFFNALVQIPVIKYHKTKRTSLKNIQPFLGNRQRTNYENPWKQLHIFQRETIKIWHKLWHTFYETLCHIVQNFTIK